MDVIAISIISTYILPAYCRYFDGNLPEDNVPYADFDAPVDSDNPKDSSATAIVASALFELFELTGTAKMRYSCTRPRLIEGSPHDSAATPTLACYSYIRSRLIESPPHDSGHHTSNTRGSGPISRSSSTLVLLAGDPTYLEKGQVYLSSLILASGYFDPTATDGWEALLRQSTAAWGEASTGSVTGDYFLLETMASTESGGQSCLGATNRDNSMQMRGTHTSLRTTGREEESRPAYRSRQHVHNYQ